MNRILDELNTIFREVLDNDSLNLTENSTANDVDNWDSLTHIQLVVAIEKHFKIRFLSSEIRNWKNVGEICNNILNRLVKN